MKNKRVSYKQATAIAQSNGFDLWQIHQKGSRGKHYRSYYLYKDNLLILHCRLLKEVKDYITTEKQVIKHIYKFDEKIDRMV